MTRHYRKAVCLIFGLKKSGRTQNIRPFQSINLHA
jgi:hypothetical protein